MAVNIHGSKYNTVAERINSLVEDYKREHDINTEIIQFDDKIVVMKATLKINDHSFTGHAYEIIGSSQVNTTSALENCETSCIGRALASAGYHGGEFASANEVENAIHQQQGSNKFDKYIPEGNNIVSSGKEFGSPKPSDPSNYNDSAIWFGAHKGKAWEDVPMTYLKKMPEWGSDITAKIPGWTKALEKANLAVNGASSPVKMDSKADSKVETDDIPF